MILYLFLSHLGVGIALTLVFVSREAGVKFFRFNAGLAAILIAIALAFFAGRAGPGGIIGPGGPGRTVGLEGVGLVALAVAEAALLLYWATVGRMLARVRPAMPRSPWEAVCSPSSSRRGPWPLATPCRCRSSPPSAS